CYKVTPPFTTQVFATRSLPNGVLGVIWPRPGRRGARPDPNDFGPGSSRGRIMMASEREPDAPPPPLRRPLWRQQPGEPAKPYAAFPHYAALGKFRSIDAVGRALYPGPPPHARVRGKTGRLVAWSVRWQWVRRALAFDEHVRREAIRAVVAEAKT